jgi:hypothetical protein
MATVTGIKGEIRSIEYTPVIRIMFPMSIPDELRERFAFGA